MGVAAYPVLENDSVDPWQTIDGKRLSRAMDELEKIAKKLRVPNLWSFYSWSAAQCAEDEEYMARRQARGRSKLMRTLERWLRMDQPVRESWYDASEGLKAIRPGSRILKDAATAVSESDLIEDLEAFEMILVYAESQKVRWHLQLDT